MQAQATPQVSRQAGGLSYKWVVAIVLVFGVFMSILDQTVVNIAIPRLQSAFGADIHSVQWVITAYLLTQGAMTPTTPFLANTIGIKRSFILSLTAFTLGSILCGLSWNLPTLIFFRIVQGLGGAILLPLSMTMLFREFPPQERGVAMATLGVPSLLAPALGPIIGGYLVTFADWRMVFFINVPVGVLAFILATLLLRESRAEGHISFDVAGFITAAYGLAAVLYGLSQTSQYGWSSMNVLAFLLSGALSLIIFVIIELAIARQGGTPLLDVRLFASRSFSSGMIGLIVVAIAMFGALFLVPIYLQVLRGQSAFQAGLLLLPQSLAMMVSVVLGGRLVDRIGVRAVVMPGLILLAISSWQLTNMTLNSPFWWVQAMLVLLGFAVGLVGQPMMVAAMVEIQEAQQVANASTVATVVRSVAASLGVSGLATLVQTQTKVHYTHLAELVTPTSPLGQMLPRLQALFMQHGADVQSAKSMVIILTARLIQKQAYMLAIRDAFFLSIAVAVLALIATFFIKERQQSNAPERLDETAEQQMSAEPAFVG
ncbi:MAG: DHA2 family efflux MFS transporter permease subunit [Ktedonobacteraceae bacterium]|nr:DHA2 family efflux MFS transporter permease subunit [Ktedonobacteraceae bacterium]